MEHFIICMEEKTPLMSKKMNKENNCKTLKCDFVFYCQYTTIPSTVYKCVHVNINNTYSICMAFQDNKCIININVCLCLQRKV